MKKLITCLCMALAATLGSATLKAQYGPLPGGGYGSSSINWKYETATRTLTLTGYGRIPDYSNLQPAPWAKHRAEIKSIVIGSGITSIGEYAFAGSSALTSVQIPAGVTQIEDYAFANCSALPAITLPIGVTVPQLLLAAFRYAAAGYAEGGRRRLCELYLPALHHAAPRPA